MENEFKCAVYARFATKAQADEGTARKLKAVQMLQNIGYKVAVAPLRFDGDNAKLTQLPPIKDWSESDKELDHIWELLHDDVTLVITGMEDDHA